MVIPRYPPRLIATELYWLVHTLALDLLRIAEPVRTNLAIMSLLAVACTVPGQAKDLFRATARDDPQTYIAFFICLFVASVVLWYSTDALIRRCPIAMNILPVARAIHRRWPNILAASPFLVAAAAFFSASRRAGGDASPSALWALSIASIALVAVIPAIVALGRLSAARALRAAPLPAFLGESRNDRVEAVRSVARALAHPTDSPGSTMHWAASIVGVGVFSAAMTIAIAEPGWATVIGPAAVLFIGAACWSLILGQVALRLSRIRFPIVSALAGILIAVQLRDCTDNHAVRHLCLPRAEIPAARAALADFIRRSDRYTPGEPFPVFLVATEGGGLRNAYWTAAVLATIQDAHPEFGHRLFAISGVSGGSVGAAVFAALLEQAPPSATSDNPPPTYAARARAILGRDLLSPLLARALLPDLFQQFWPLPIEAIDRARALEESLERAWTKAEEHNRLGRGFYASRPNREGARTPFLILNTTNVETGERTAISQLSLGGRVRTFDSVIDDARTEARGMDIPVSTAAMLSARFPIVTPAGTVHVHGGKLRFADGGYFENSGCASLADLLELLLRPELAKKVERPDEDIIADARFVVIRIRYLDPDGRIEPRQRPHSFNDAMSPIRALLRTREARGALSRQILDEIVREAPSDPDSGGFLVLPYVLTFDCHDTGTPVPLGWILSKAARDSLDAQATADRSDPASTTTCAQALAVIGNVIAGEMFAEPSASEHPEPSPQPPAPEP